MANRYKDPNELNKRYMPEDDDEEYIPEEELTEEEREMVKTLSSFTAKDWQMIIEAIMDEEDYTLSSEEYAAKTILAKLNSALRQEGEIAYQFRLALANSLYPDEAFYVVERLKKKPEEGANIPPEMLEIIYAKAKEYKG
jgi:hypothetical protein